MSQDFTLVSGDTLALEIVITDPTGAAVDLTTAAAITWLLIDRRTRQPVITKTLADGITVGEIYQNVIIVNLAPADSAALAGLYAHELEVRDHAGGVWTPVQGMAQVAADWLLAGATCGAPCGPSWLLAGAEIGLLPADNAFLLLILWLAACSLQLTAVNCTPGTRSRVQLHGVMPRTVQMHGVLRRQVQFTACIDGWTAVIIAGPWFNFSDPVHSMYLGLW